MNYESDQFGETVCKCGHVGDQHSEVFDDDVAFLGDCELCLSCGHLHAGVSEKDTGVAQPCDECECTAPQWCGCEDFAPAEA